MINTRCPLPDAGTLMVVGPMSVYVESDNPVSPLERKNGSNDEFTAFAGAAKPGGPVTPCGPAAPLQTNWTLPAPSVYLRPPVAQLTPAGSGRPMTLWPAGPAGPVRPCNPSAPGGPVGPIGPAAPTSPFGPCIP